MFSLRIVLPKTSLLEFMPSKSRLFLGRPLRLLLWPGKLLFGRFNQLPRNVQPTSYVGTHHVGHSLSLAVSQWLSRRRPHCILPMFLPPAVLVVEDDEMLRWATASLIGGTGLAVLEARNADEAISILEQRSDIRVMVTDVMMPGSMDGLKLAHAVRHRWPPIEIIILSGQENVPSAALPPRCFFFAKPADPEILIAAVRRFGT